jgi:hypothetical protein
MKADWMTETTLTEYRIQNTACEASLKPLEYSHGTYPAKRDSGRR